jgi:hypothetical protein
MFFWFCPHIFCNFSESGVRELFNIFYSEGGTIKLETAVTWSKSNLNMMNIYEESTINFWICFKNQHTSINILLAFWLKTGGVLMRSERSSSFCTACDTRHVTHVTNPVISHECNCKMENWGKAKIKLNIYFDIRINNAKQKIFISRSTYYASSRCLLP